MWFQTGMLCDSTYNSMSLAPTAVSKTLAVFDIDTQSSEPSFSMMAHLIACPYASATAKNHCQLGIEKAEQEYGYSVVSYVTENDRGSQNSRQQLRPWLMGLCFAHQVSF